MAARERLKWPDQIKGLAIICVIAAHSGYVHPVVNQFISFFTLPSFLMISGYMLGYTGGAERSPGSFTGRLLAGIMKPYLIFSLIITAIDMIMLMRGRYTAETVGGYILDALCLYGRGTLWFLPSLFLAELFVYLALKFLKKPAAVILVMLAAVAAGLAAAGVREPETVAGETLLRLVPVHMLKVLLRSLYMSAFVMWGYLLWLFMKSREDKEKKILPVMAVAGIAALITGMRYHSLMDIHLCNLGEPVSALIIGFLTAAGAFAVFVMLKPAGVLSRILAFLGVNSLTIMATHVEFYFLYFSYVALDIVRRFIEAGQWFSFFFVIIFILIAETVFILVLRKAKKTIKQITVFL